MARLPRFDLADIPQHVVQRGNNRLPCFLDDGDRSRYLTLLKDALLKNRCRLHAYVLMSNHVHLLVTPPETGAIGRMMQQLGRNYVSLFNARHHRTGTLWEGRYKACLVDNEDYVLRCYRYIELNPVRACMIDDAAAYRWSSCAANTGLLLCSDLHPHPAYLALGADIAERCQAYRGLLEETMPYDVIQQIRVYLQQQRALGRDSFQNMVAAKMRRFAGIRPAHRPCSQDGPESKSSDK
ncbi:MAG: transposase [Rudaea sp.]|uniref:transposase n=1 Tax=Rudaea sp. TaxID=2136325 RepID=UPI0039E4823E